MASKEAGLSNWETWLLPETLPSAARLSDLRTRGFAPSPYRKLAFSGQYPHTLVSIKVQLPRLFEFSICILRHIFPEGNRILVLLISSSIATTPVGSPFIISLFHYSCKTRASKDARLVP